MSAGYISRQRIDTSLRKNEKTAIKLKNFNKIQPRIDVSLLENEKSF